MGLVTHSRAVEEAAKLFDKEYRRGWDAVKAGKPVVWLMYGPPREILHCFDIVDIYPENYGALCAVKKKTSPYIEYAGADGFSDHICGLLRVAFGYTIAMVRGESSSDAAFGGMPPPNMLVSSSRTCDPRTKVFETMRRYLNIPAFIYDQQPAPVEQRRCTDREACRHYIEHNRQQLLGLVNFLEEQTGRKLDIDRLRELLTTSVEMWRVFQNIRELRKKSPCPMPSEDFFTSWRPYLDMAGEKEALQFLRNIQSEVEERVRNRISVVPEEKYRILWVGPPTWFDLELFNYLESRGAVSVTESMYNSSPPREVDIADPLRGLAEKWFWGWDMHGDSDGSQARCGIAPGYSVLEMARNYDVHGVIAHTVFSCRAVAIGTRHMIKVLREQFGLPVLTIESHMTDPRSYSHAEVREKLDAFIQVLESRRH